VSKKGFTLVELMVVVALFIFMLAAMYGVLLSGQASWFTTDANIEVQENVRKTLSRISSELRQSGFDSGGIDQVAITDGGGPNGTDIVKFSVPVLCEAGSNFLDANGDVAHWGAPLTWGCTNSGCMDADDDCDTVDYASVEYRLDANNQLLRRVLNGVGGQVRVDIFAQNISDFQLTRSVDNNVITIQIAVQKKSALNRTMTATVSMNVYLRNAG